jgi:hypothetical protein
VHSLWVAHPRSPSEPVGEPGVQCAGPVASVEPRMRNQLVSTVPSLPHKASRWASANQPRPESGYELGQTGASWRTLLVVWRQWAEARRSGLGRGGLGLAPIMVGGGSHSVPSLGGGKIHH